MNNGREDNTAVRGVPGAFIVLVAVLATIRGVLGGFKVTVLAPVVTEVVFVVLLLVAIAMLGMISSPFMLLC